MKNFFIIFVSLISIFIFAGFNITNASSISLRKSFGGRIIEKPATAVRSLEGAGFTCVEPGTSIDIMPIGGKFPTSYFIVGNRSVTGTIPTVNQLILGLYSVVPSQATCTSKSTPPVVEVISLPTITYFGTSK